LAFEVELRDEILRQWVRFTYEKLHKNGIFHLDYSQGNTLITKTDDGKYEFSIVDLNRMTFGPISFEKGLSNFCRLGVDRSTLELIAREYALLRHENSAKAAKSIVIINRKSGENLKKREYFKVLLSRVFKSGRDGK
jgi:hypothetical protein